MKKTLLATAIPALFLATSVSAVELYNDQGTTFSIGGWLDAGVTGSENGDTDVYSNSSRIKFFGTQDLGNGFVADVKGEWEVNVLEGGEETFSTRLGYIGLTHETYGRTVIGTQWAPYCDVACVTDMPIAFANDFAYQDHYNMGTARGEKMISYRKGIDFGNAGALNLGVAWQGEHDIYDARYQAAVTYKVMDFSLGYAYNAGDISDVDTTAQVISATYGSYGNGLYVAGAYADNENVAGAYADNLAVRADTNNYELVAAYSLENSLTFNVNYEVIEDDNANSDIIEQSAVQVEYNFLSNFVGYAGYQFDLNDATDDDVWAFGFRYIL